MGLLVGVSVAERMGVPMLRAQVEPPALPTSYSSYGQKSAKARLRSRWTATLDAGFNLLLWNVLRESTNSARAKVLALPPLPRVPWDSTSAAAVRIQSRSGAGASGLSGVASYHRLLVHGGQAGLGSAA